MLNLGYCATHDLSFIRASVVKPKLIKCVGWNDDGEIFNARLANLDEFKLKPIRAQNNSAVNLLFTSHETIRLRIMLSKNLQQEFTVQLGLSKEG